MSKLNSKKEDISQPCPCGAKKSFFDCCEKFISNKQIPSTPEELMRSRYTAYNQANIDYIMKTMKAPAADHFDSKNERELAKKISWSGLEVIKTSQDDNKGMVEYIAYYSVEGEKNILHEISEFNFENGRWFYINGMQPNKTPQRAEEKIGRNDKCPCGSDKKYKKCCG